MSDLINNPPHYKSHPSGVECIQITEHMSFTLGNAMKYIWRADEKGSAIEDLKKAEFYIKREIERREAGDGIQRAAQLEGDEAISLSRDDVEKLKLNVESKEAQKVVDRMTAQVNRTNPTLREASLAAWASS
jgi:DNA polymerase III sliding clamp (beta) subunit (PCNA family)